jgi:plastocyanin
MSRVRLLSIALVPVAVLALAAPVLAANAGVRMTESNERYHFTASSITIHVGDIVTWTNTTDAPHTVTSSSGGELGSNTIADGATYAHTFSTAGAFAYHCTIHPYMTGQVIVLASAGATAPATDTEALASPSGPSVVLVALLALVGLGATLLALVLPDRGRNP